MTSRQPPPAWIVSLANHLEPVGGGVQICTQEYLQTIRLAGWEPVPKAYRPDMRPLTRLRRKLRPTPFADVLPPAFIDELVQALPTERPEIVFFNQVDTAPVAGRLRPLAGRPPLVLLSHGAKIVDELHHARLGHGVPGDLQLGATLRRESELRAAFDHVFTLSAEECVFESWLGARSVSWLPRAVQSDPLPWAPVSGRVGFVGTLDHPPNLAGLRDLLCELRQAPPSLRVRLVGGSPARGEALAAEFAWVDYLGPLDAAGLRAEAASWSCFLHPLFLLARGCSTKLSQALGWQLPILTTRVGARGYRFEADDLAFAETAPAFARRTLELSDPVRSAPLREGVRRTAAAAPTLAAIAQQLRSDLQPHLDQSGARDDVRG